ATAAVLLPIAALPPIAARRRAVAATAFPPLLRPRLRLPLRLPPRPRKLLPSPSLRRPLALRSASARSASSAKRNLPIGPLALWWSAGNKRPSQHARLGDLPGGRCCILGAHNCR